MKATFMERGFMKATIRSLQASMVAFMYPKDMKVAFMYHGGRRSGGSD
jgi:hypothetical protein